ncbi:hypothetical protein BOTBODRAFT_39119 [Botryobasidium botryosum FD-172 SS1]|uniref:Vacuolar protein sorting-associated protein 54 n=1 Tax=Botryobasidium botryosum (strain FD-172 SS1) TaxID=930990 RepID=A0A067M651_BOTB1|nr:hypothetical protein BOTBODRAFT_39119 [Botryobasidium botryosum FD-172 SS1]
MTSPATSRPSSPTSDVAPQAAHPSAFRFRWDAAKHPGPPSISEATESRLDLDDEPTPRNLGGLFPIPNPGISSPRNFSFPLSWSSNQHGFNAISTVLNNPHRPPAPLKSSRAPFPSNTSPDLPRVRRKDFDPYLRTIGPEWELFEANAHLGVDGASEPVGHSEANGASPAPLSKNIPPLSTVPPLFFDPAFNLGNPRTFASVTEQDSPLSSSTNFQPEDISLNQILQEKLSHYMDVVEQHLAQEIAARSASFFAALSNLQDLQTEGSDCLVRISQLKKELMEVDEQQAKKGLQVVRLLKRRENLDSVQQGTRFIGEVEEMLTMCNKLVTGGSWHEALALIEEVEDLFKGPAHGKLVRDGVQPPKLAPPDFSDSSRLKPKSKAAFIPSALSSVPELSPPPSPSSSRHHEHPPIPLSSLSAFSHLPAHLQSLTISISASLESSLVAILRSDLSERAHGAGAEDADLRERLRPLLQGLSRTNAIPGAMDKYRSAALTEIKLVIKKHLPASDAEDDESAGELPEHISAVSEKSLLLAKELRDMPHQRFIELLRSMYSSVLACVDSVATHVKLISELLENALSSPPTHSDSSPFPSSDITAITDLVPAVIELANTRASKIIGVRQDQHASLDISHFCAFFNQSWSFVVQSEVLARRMVVSLRGVMVNQAKSFLSAFHATRISESARLVENETWSQVEVPLSAQRSIDVLVLAAVSDPPEIVIAPESTSDLSDPPSAVNDAERENGAADSNQQPAKQLNIEDRGYFVVSATLEVLLLLVDYIKTIVNLPLLTTDAMSRAIEFLKAFNSRTCQVVLGAGAMRSAGLKNITAKHLALASQSLSIMIALIPYVRETFRRHLSPKQAVMLVEFDKLKRDYQEHQNEIHSKLIAIMSDRLAVHCKALQEVKWDAPQSPTATVNPYMELLVKETVTLHKVLSKYLTLPAVEYVMSQVFAAINHRLGEEYGKIELPSQEAKLRMIQDARYLQERFSNLKNIASPSSMLETIVSEKSVGQPQPPSPAAAPRRGPFARRTFSSMLSKATGGNAPAVTSAEEKPALGQQASTDSVPEPVEPQSQPLDDKPQIAEASADGGEAQAEGPGVETSEHDSSTQ